MITDYIYRGVFVLLIFKLLMTMYQRKFNDTGGHKRIISLYQSLFLGVLYIIISTVLARGFNQNLIYVVLLVSIFVAFLLRGTLFPYTTKCETCKKKLNINQILFLDSTKCSNCKNLH